MLSETRLMTRDALKSTAVGNRQSTQEYSFKLHNFYLAQRLAKQSYTKHRGLRQPIIYTSRGDRNSWINLSLKYVFGRFNSNLIYIIPGRCSWQNTIECGRWHQASCVISYIKNQWKSMWLGRKVIANYLR